MIAVVIRIVIGFASVFLDSSGSILLSLFLLHFFGDGVRGESFQSTGIAWG